MPRSPVERAAALVEEQRWRLWDLQECVEYSDKGYTSWHRWVRAKKVHWMLDGWTRPRRYLITSAQLSAVIRTTPGKTPPFVPPPSVKQLRAQFPHKRRRPDLVPPPRLDDLFLR